MASSVADIHRFIQGKTVLLAGAGRSHRLFVLRDGQCERLPPAADGRLHSEIFAGLWLAPAALVRHDLTTVLAVVQQGIASPEHAACIARLRNAYYFRTWNRVKIHKCGFDRYTGRSHAGDLVNLPYEDVDPISGGKPTNAAGDTFKLYFHGARLIQRFFW